MGMQPELWVDRGASAVAFYATAFGASVLHRFGDGEDIVAQLAVGDAVFWISTVPSVGETGRRRNPNAIGGATGRTLFVVDDPDSMFERAIAAGATATSPPGDEHGWRLARLIDPFGHEWEIGHPLGTWPPPQ
jgi:PhnB protein